MSLTRAPCSSLARPRARFDIRARARRFAIVLLAGCAGSSTSSQPIAAPQLTPVAEHYPPLLAPLRVADVGFETPESVLYDLSNDVYLVSNVVGSAREADDRAFISRVRPDGTLAALKWIDAEHADIELNAPKGMAIVTGILYVADIDRVRKFDSASGRPLGAIAIANASFLHDVTAAPDGSLYVSDSGLSEGLTANGKDAIYRITKQEQVTRIASDRALGQPSGLWASASGLYVVSFGGGELYRLDDSGRRSDIVRLPKGSLDGLAMFEERVFVSSWEGAAIYEQSAQGFVERLTNMHSASDLAIDTRRRRLLVTHYDENALSIHQL